MSSLSQNELQILIVALSQMREKILETTKTEPVLVNGLLNKASDYLADLQTVELMQAQTAPLPFDKPPHG